MEWPALQGQWFLVDPAWTHVLDAPLGPTQTSEGQLWAYTGAEPESPPPTLVPDGRTAMWTRTRLAGDVFDAIENFLDPMHTPFIHPGLVRSEGARRPTRVRIERQGPAIEAVYEKPAATGLIRRTFGLGIDETRGRFRPPSLVELDYRASGHLRLRILLGFTPLARGELGLTVGLFTPLPRPVAWLLGIPLVPLLGLALRQDAHIIALKSEHERRWFPERRYTHTSNDFLGPHILRWLRTGRTGGRERTVDVLL